MLKSKEIQITKNTFISVGRFDEQKLRPDVVRFYFKNSMVSSFVVSSLEKRAYAHAYEILDEMASHEAQAFILGCTTQKEVMETLKGIKAIRKDLDDNNEALFNIFLKAFDAN